MFGVDDRELLGAGTNHELRVRFMKNVWRSLEALVSNIIIEHELHVDLWMYRIGTFFGYVDILVAIKAANLR